MVKKSLVAILVSAWLFLSGAAWTASQKFYPDDPIAREPESQDAAGAQEWDIDLFFDLMYGTFATPRMITPGRRAANVNTADEVPDSNWFTNRILARPLSLDQLITGPNTLPPERQGIGFRTAGKVTIIKPKNVGAAPGVVVRGPLGETWFVSFDPPGHPGGATGALVVASKIFWALGYWQPEQYLANLREEDFEIAAEALIRPSSGRKRPMTRADLKALLGRVQANPDGSYRVVGSRLLPGKVLGGFRYHGTRPDDPNDVVPHEDRRELRALKVFGAWTNLVDIKAGNTIDTLIGDGGKSVVRHWLQDVGSTFGMGANGPHDWDEGWESLFAGDPLWKRLVSFGFYLQPWQTARYEAHPSVGIFEGDAFEPETWSPRVPAGALLAARDDDHFWAARRVMAFSDEMIRGVVTAARFTDPAAERILAEVLIKRRDKIGRAYLPKVNPLVDFALDETGALTFVNAAVQAKVAAAPAGGYEARWFTFDNATGDTRPIGSPTRAMGERLPVAAGLPAATGAFIQVDVRAIDPAHAAWATPVRVYFRRTAQSWALAGLDRLD